MVRPWWRLGLLVGLIAGASMLPTGGATGSCAGPEITVDAVGADPPTLLVGGEVTVRGKRFVEGCDDSGGGDVFGCSTDEGEEEVPLRDIALELRQGGRTWQLGSADASEGKGEGRLGDVTWTVRVPAEPDQGIAMLVADGARLKVRIGGRLHTDQLPAD